MLAAPSDPMGFASRFFSYFLRFSRAENVNSDALNNAGNNGNYWSSTVNSATNARNLNFNSTNVNPTNTNNRYNGFTVRCVAE